jgi:SAM-dependent methyltransferase
MRWTHKARIQNAIASLPVGSAAVYYAVQRLFGGLRKGRNNPVDRFAAAVRIVDAIERAGQSISGKRFLEVGTGHLANVPTALWLMGAGETVTVDVNHYLSETLMAESMEYLRQHVAEISSLFGSRADDPDFTRRLRHVLEFRGGSAELLETMNVRYLCPCDATALPIPDDSFDFHISNTVFEHIPPAVLSGILREARRILSNDGMVVHIVDLSDHFSHDDRSIPAVHFLRYTDEEWNRIAGNRFMYQNRLRAPDYLEIFREAGVTMLEVASVVDERSSMTLNDGFPVDTRFSALSKDELATRELLLVGKFDA